ncbi:MAG TPA: DUF1540 domain-containing protein [Clostridia bacterium]|nr:DUF1540 domain-containing protein [Clostridia bacterium]
MNFINQIADKIGKNEHVRGIHCEVTNCVYHDRKGKCAADEIKVGPTYASNSTETVCSTFEPK